MNEFLAPLISFSIAAIGGFLAGYAVRKIIKLVFIVIGLFILCMIILQGAGWVNADYGRIVNDTQTFVNNTNLYPQLTSFTNQFSIFVLFGLGIGGVIGFIRGK